MTVLGSLLGRLRRAPVEDTDVPVEKLLSDGMAAFLRGDLPQAWRSSELAIVAAPQNPDALYLAGVVSYARGDWDIGVAYLEQAIERGGAVPAYLKDYGSFLAGVGRHREGLAVLQRALDLKPDSVQVHSNLLFVISCCDHVSPVEVYEAHRRFGEDVADPLLPQPCVHANTRDAERPLTVGYVSADLRDHAALHFIEPVLEGHDRSRYRVVCYNNGPDSGNVTARLRALADRWRDIAGVSDEDVVTLMREDGIDILVDLSGHTRGNRLRVFAHKPAPVQATWFGAIQTTGMRAMDWRITDARLDPPGMTEHLSREKLVRLAHSYACFRPHPGSPPVGPLPALAGGSARGITFAAFNSGYKTNDAVVALWARLINSVPNSRLMLVVDHGDMPDIRRLVAARFETHGLDPARLEIAGRQPVAAFLALFNSVDVLLDPFPQNGGITSLHALWMGVPVISLAGAAPIGRIAVSLLGQLGLDAFVARDQDEYVAIARRCAERPAELEKLRSGLRERMRSSTLMNEKGFISDLESAYRGMWREWCRAV
jgi:predicted O-linked N-acetylglucosamine transferase (SPINDLY family)